MIIKITYLMLLSLLISSCTVDKLEYKLDQELNYTDLLNLEKYKILNKDEKYRAAIFEKWVTNIKCVKKTYFARIPLNGEYNKHNYKQWESAIEKETTKPNPNHIDTLKALAYLSYFNDRSSDARFKVYGDCLSTSVYNEEYLNRQYSKEKIKIINEFESELETIIYHITKYPINASVKEIEINKNYNIYNSIIREDEKLYNYIENIKTTFSEFVLENIDLKSTLMLNKMINKNQNNIDLVTYGNKVYNANGEFKVNVDSKILKRYYEDINIILNSMKYIEIDFPFKDWSIKKQEACIFIIKDIKVKLQSEISSLNL